MREYIKIMTAYKMGYDHKAFGRKLNEVITTTIFNSNHNSTPMKSAHSLALRTHRCKTYALLEALPRICYQSPIDMSKHRDVVTLN